MRNFEYKNWSEFGQSFGHSYPNGCVSAYAYDTKSDLVTVSNLGPKRELISSYNYTYSASGNRTRMEEPDRITAYAYDSKYQLVGAEVSKKGKGRFCKERLYDVRYTYDAVGNRIAMELDTEHGQSLPFQSYAPTHDRQPQLKHPLRVEYAYNNADQLVSETAWRIEGKWRKKEKRAWETAYTYDANGNVMTKALTKKQGCERDEDEEAWEEECKCNNKCRKKEHKGCLRQTIYEYDYANLLNRITYPDGEINTFQNCRCGTFRLQKTDSQGLRNYIYDKENDSPIFETDENYNPVIKYIKGPRIDELISKKYITDNGKWKTVYYLYDGLGSVRQLVDERGKVVAEYDYLPFGEIIKAGGKEAMNNAFTFTGREYERDSGLYYYRARYMDPRLGRFTSKDPIWDIASPVSRQVRTETMTALYQMAMLQLSLASNETRSTKDRRELVAGAIADMKRLGVVASGDPTFALYLGGLNQYVFCANNPVNFVDPFGLWYIDINVSGGFWGGFTGGVLISRTGVYPYIGGGVVTPGVGGSITWSPSDPSPGWNAGLAVQAILAGQAGYGFCEKGESFWEVGLGASYPTIAGASLTGYYVFEPSQQ